jgi:hypothetical protein
MLFSLFASTVDRIRKRQTAVEPVDEDGGHDQNREPHGRGA